MTQRKETKAETEIRRTIRMTCEGLGLPLSEAESIASRAIKTLRASKARLHRVQALPVAARPAMQPKSTVKRKGSPIIKPEPSELRNDNKLIDHLIARRHKV